MTDTEIRVTLARLREDIAEATSEEERAELRERLALLEYQSER